MRSKFEEEALIALTMYYSSPYDLRGVQVIVPNSSYLGHECDVLVVQKSGYATEIELKATASDLKADKKKVHGHRSHYIRQIYYGLSEDIPQAAIDEHVPEHAGIIIFRKHSAKSSYRGLYCSIERKPKPNTTAPKLTNEQIQYLTKTLYYRYYHLLHEKVSKSFQEEKTMTRRVLYFTGYPGQIFATPEYNGDKSEFEKFGSKDICHRDWVGIEAEFRDVKTIEDFKSANKRAQSCYCSSVTGEPSIHPVVPDSDAMIFNLRKINDVVLIREL
jgi:hypothetical protein